MTAPVTRFEDLSKLVTRGTDGLILFLASDREDDERIDAAMRELSLLQLPPSIAVLQTETYTISQRNEAAPTRFVWPVHAKELNVWIRRNLTAGEPFVDPVTESCRDRISRKLLALTPSLAPLIEQIEIAASHDVTVLIEGETGTGKTHLAKLIHECSSRSPHRFVVVSCGALSGNLIASEIFGHVKGAFTGADSNKVGKFAAAGRGTLLLDEIDTLGLDHQANLLRVIETGEYEPVGSHEMQFCDARFIAATNNNLADAVEHGSFRGDLYYRLHVITFQLPALRDRVQDIGPLVRGMISRYNQKFGKRISSLSSEAQRSLESFPWPGNIRQLENVVQQAVLTCAGPELEWSHLSPVVRLQNGPRQQEAIGSSLTSTLAMNRETTERMVIVRTLEKASFSRTRAAQLLGVSRVTLYKKMKKYGLLSKADPEMALPR